MTEHSPAPDEGTPSARWEETPERLSATFEFASFREAMAFMASCTEAIDALDHHPDWSNSYRRVHVALTTHSAGGRVTDLDRRLAVLLDRAYEARGDDRGD